MEIKKIVNNLNKFNLLGREGPELKPPLPVEKLLLSFEGFKVIDLICEGPIGGVVDKNGRYAEGLDSLCGLYLNEVPVKETSKSRTPFYQFPIKKSTTIGYGDLSIFLKQTAIPGFEQILNEDGSKDLQPSEEMIAQAKNLISFANSLSNFFDLSEEELINYNNSLNKQISPLLFLSNDIKFLVLEPQNLINFVTENNATRDYPNIKVMWRSTDGEIGELKSRFKRSLTKKKFNFNEIIPELPISIDAFIFKYNGQKKYYYADKGFIIIPFASNDQISVIGDKLYIDSVDSDCIDPISTEKLTGAEIFLAIENEDATWQDNVYNYNQVKFEFIEGYEDQLPSIFSKKTTRSISKSFNLKGPIDGSSFIDRIDPIELTTQLEPSDIEASYSTEGSLYIDSPSIYSSLSREDLINTVTANQISRDKFQLKVDLKKVRTGSVEYDYADWVRPSIPSNTERKREIFKHIIETETVNDISVVFTISQLYDQNIRTVEQAGKQLPAFLELAIVVGMEGDENENDPLYKTLIQQKRIITFTIEGLVQQGYRFKVGGGKSFVGQKNTFSNIENLKEILLPKSIDGRNRYVKVFRITPETFSAKRVIDVSVTAIEENQSNFFSYPLSAISSLYFDSRAYSNLPSRTLDLRLKKILIPSNYYPLYYDGTDRREIKNKLSYNNNVQIYKGDWDGTFRYDWSDNPAWILYDLLTNPIYGIGSSIDALEDINIWRLYEIGKYCDAVNDNGYFIGVDDGYGGLEPRFSCNIMINDETEAFDIINTIATIFRGNVFYAGSEIDFYYDRPQEPIALFNNKNVADGLFSYSDTLKNSRYTTVEVPYIDKRDDFIQKIEYFEDEENIDRYGYIKKTFQGVGITSRSQALRFAKYALLSNKYETEQVTFIASDEAMFVEPGDIIRIDDVLKNIETSTNIIADIDYENKYIISQLMETGGFGEYLYLYKSNGQKNIEQIFEEVYEQSLEFNLERQNSYQTENYLSLKIDSFELTGTNNGGTGIKINLDTNESNINELNDVNIGSVFSIQLTGRNDNLYKIISKIESDGGQFEILALKSEQRKYLEIESGIKFDSDEEYFKNLSFDYNDNDPSPPASVSLTTGSDLNGVYIQVQIVENNSWPLTDKYECLLISPQGNVSTEIIKNTSTTVSVKFYNIREFNGIYEARVFSIGKKPLKLKSSSYTSDTISFSLASVAIYTKLYFKDVYLDGKRGDFLASSSSDGIGSFTLYLDKSLRLSWTIVDRLGYILSSANDYLSHYDKPYISIDLLDSSGTLLKENIKENIVDSYAFFSKYEIEKYFNGEYERSFKLRLKLYGSSYSGYHNSTITILAPSPILNSVGVSSVYDGLANQFILYGDTFAKFKEKIEKIEIYTGSSDLIDESNSDNLLITIDNAKDFLRNKSVKLANHSIYPIIVEDTLFAPESVKDRLFFHGEKVSLISSQQADYSNGLSTNREYEIILGKTLDSFFMFNSDYSYEKGHNSDSLYSMSYYYTGDSTSFWDQIDELSISDSFDHQNGGVGLLYGENGDYVFNDDSKSLALTRGISQKGYRKNVDSVFNFNNNGIRIAESGSQDYPMKRKRSSATYTAVYKTTIKEEPQVIFDFGSPTGGFLYYLGYQGLKGTYNINAVTFDSGSNNTGEKINLTGHIFPGVEQGELNDVVTLFTAITFQSFPDPISQESFVEARFYLNGDLLNSQSVSGWAINEHNHACGIGVMIGDSVDASINGKGSGITGDFLEFGMYNYAFSPQEVFKNYIDTRNEYLFKLSTGNKEIFDIGQNNTEDTLTMYSVNSNSFEIRIGEGASRVKNGTIDLYSELLNKDLMTGVSKQPTFLKTQNSSDYQIIEDILASPFYLSEKDYLDENYVWLNFENPIYKLRYLPNVADFDDPASLFIYSESQYNTYKVTGAYVYEVAGQRYLQAYISGDSSFENSYTVGDTGFFRNLTGLNISPSKLFFIDYSGGAGVYKYPNFYIDNSTTPTGELIFQETATLRKLETTGVQNGNWQGYIGGINGKEINGNGNFKRYDTSFNDFISVTGYYPYGRWIIYSGISPSGNVGDLSWGGYDVLYQYTGDGQLVDRPQGQIKIEKDFNNWSNSSNILDISKNIPSPAIFEIFPTDYSLFGRNAKDINKNIVLANQLDENTAAQYADFYVKFKIFDFIGGVVDNSTYLINYAFKSSLNNNNQISNLIAFNEALADLNKKIQDAQQRIWQDLYSVEADSYQEYIDAESLFKEVPTISFNTSLSKLSTPQMLFTGDVFNLNEANQSKFFQFRTGDDNCLLYYRYRINGGDFNEFAQAENDGGPKQFKTVNIQLSNGMKIDFEFYTFKQGFQKSNTAKRTIQFTFTGITDDPEIGDNDGDETSTDPSEPTTDPTQEDLNRNNAGAAQNLETP